MACVFCYHIPCIVQALCPNLGVIITSQTDHFSKFLQLPFSNDPLEVSALYSNSCNKHYVYYRLRYYCG